MHLSPSPKTSPSVPIVGEFNATDPDANATLTYLLVSGAGDGNNSLFTLETNGTLKTATIFDYESNVSTYSIRVHAKDEFNASVEGNFTVSLTDIYEPSQPNHLVDLNSSVNLEMIWVEPGTFTRGQVGVAEPVHDVTLTKGLYLGKYEVTQAQYEAVMMGNTDGLSATPSNWFNNPNRPVEKVSWDDAQKFLIRLNELEQENVSPGWAYILPTEAEWEYACRSGTTTAFSWGSTINSEHANGPSSGYAMTRNVGLYPANPWGFFDMHGNVWEWTADASGSYSAGSQVDPYNQGGADSYRVSRGGSWGFSDELLRSARRAFDLSNHRDGGFGFRLAYKYTNKSPHDLNSTAPLNFAENQPIGTVVGEFNAIDPDVNATLTYSLVSGAGDGNNSLFTLETNGTLKTAATFDYESNASTYTIRVQAKDEYNATVEGNFTVSLTDDAFEDTDGDGFRDSLEVFTGSDLNDPNSTPLHKGLVAWYPFDGSASDMSGNGLDGVVYGASLGKDRHDKEGRSYQFDGNDYIKISQNPILDISNNVTISVWFKGNQLANEAGIIIYGKEGSWGRTSYGVWSSSYSVVSSFSTSSSSGFMVGSNSLNNGVWYNMSFIFSDGVGKTYLNGMINQTQTASHNTLYLDDGRDLRIGVDHPGGPEFFNGSIDDIRIYNRALSAEEIRLLYEVDAELPIGSVTSAKLSPALSDLIDGNGSLELALPAGSVIARKPGEASPPGYTLFQRNEYNASLVWEEMAPVSVARRVFDGAVVFNSKIYVAGGYNSTEGFNIFETYDPSSNEWQTLPSFSESRVGLACAVLQG